MTVHFATDTVLIEESDLDILFVGFYTEENYLMIQQSLGEYDEQDVRLGMNTYHIERDDQSYGGYGGVQQMLLRRNVIEVMLDETGKQNLQCDEIKIDFETDEENYQLLTEKLAYIFGSSLVVG
jgi:hypothetical protein